jgi:hypothetical protein
VDFEVSGNGSNSTSSVQVTNTPSTQVVQSNESNVENNVSQTATTGQNTADKNQAHSTSVLTGDIQNKTTITNSSNANSTTDCCKGQSGEAAIISNGSQSSNDIKVDTSQTTTVASTNKATINNTVIMNAETGHNKANENSGSVSISTGSVKATTGITNTGINTTYTTGGTSDTKINTKISGNAVGSTNGIEITNRGITSVTTMNSAFVSNTVFQNFNTGNNIANGNVGPVTITTGDILASTLVTNTDINATHTIGNCVECKSTPPPTVVPSDPPSNPSTNTEVGRGGSSSDIVTATSLAAANSVGEVLGAMLPATGANSMLSIYILNSFLLLAGMYLRFKNTLAPLVITFEIFV